MRRDRPSSAPPDLLVRAALRLQRALLWCARRLAPPEAISADLASGIAWSQALGAVVRAGVADAFDDSEAAEPLAARLGLNPDLLYRTIRTLASRGIFTLGRDGRIHHTASSRALQRAHPSGARDFVLYFTSRSNVSAWEHFGWTLTTGDSAFEHVHDLKVWDWLDAHPDERDTFARAMNGMTRRHGRVVSRLYPFDEIETLCDVGGGTGLLLSQILVQYPLLTGILCDVPGVLESARTHIAACGLADRVRFAPGSFFDRVPAGAHAYVLKNILHDWDDDDCVRILRVVRQACTATSRLLIVESLVPRLSHDLIGTSADLQMAVVCSRGRERDAAHFQRLVRAAGFDAGRVFPSPIISVVEATVAAV